MFIIFALIIIECYDIIVFTIMIFGFVIKVPQEQVRLKVFIVRVNVKKKKRTENQYRLHSTESLNYCVLFQCIYIRANNKKVPNRKSIYRSPLELDAARGTSTALR